MTVSGLRRGGLGLDFTADHALDSKDAEVALELMTTGGLGGLPRVATLRYDYRNQPVEGEDDERYCSIFTCCRLVC